MPLFHEHWFDGSCRVILANLVRSVDDIPGRIIEIGSWEGKSTIAMANASWRCVHAVDTWLGCATDESGQLAAQRDVHAQWAANIAEATAGNVAEHWMDWRDYRATDETPIALLFIDAEHTYDEVTSTIDAFRPLMSPGGIICGDDWYLPEVARAVTDRLPSANHEHAVWWATIEGGET